MKPSFFALAVMLVLTGCAGLPLKPTGEGNLPAWQRRVARISAISHWQLAGRMSLRNHETAYQASLRWQRRRDRHDIDLTGPFGSGFVRLRQDRFGAEMRDRDKNVYRAKDVQTLLYQTTGWDLPLQGMKYWVLGLSMPGHQAEKHIDSRGRLLTLKQLGWHIRFIQYQTHAGLELPRKIFLSRQLPAAAKFDEGHHRLLEVRLVISQWQLPQAKATTLVID